MIQGVVNARSEAIVRVRLRGPGGTESDVEAVIDTGFSSSLTLPSATRTALGLARQSGGTATLADGSLAKFDGCAAEVLWMGIWRPVLVHSLGNPPLLGMGLLARHALRVDVLA